MKSYASMTNIICRLNAAKPMNSTWRLCKGRNPLGELVEN